MAERFANKVILISRAARGQGADEARRFVAEGARVVLGDVLVEESEALAAELGAHASSIALDVTSPETWDHAVRTATERIGGLDVLVNNAGIVLGTPIIGGDVDDYLRVIMVNQVGVYLGMRAAAPAMIERGGGSIVNISSISAGEGHRGPVQTSYPRWRRGRERRKPDLRARRRGCISHKTDRHPQP